MASNALTTPRQAMSLRDAMDRLMAQSFFAPFEAVMAFA